MRRTGSYRNHGNVRTSHHAERSTDCFGGDVNNCRRCEFLSFSWFVECCQLLGFLALSLRILEPSVANYFQSPIKFQELQSEEVYSQRIFSRSFLLLTLALSTSVSWPSSTFEVWSNVSQRGLQMVLSPVDLSRLAPDLRAGGETLVLLRYY